MLLQSGAPSQEGEEKLVKAGEGWDPIQLSDCRNGRSQIVFYSVFERTCAQDTFESELGWSSYIFRVKDIVACSHSWLKQWGWKREL